MTEGYVDSMPRYMLIPPTFSRSSKVRGGGVVQFSVLPVVTRLWRGYWVQACV